MQKQQGITLWCISSLRSSHSSWNSLNSPWERRTPAVEQQYLPLFTNENTFGREMPASCSALYIAG